MPRSEPVDERGYPLNPRNLGKDAWFYEEPRGLYVCTQNLGCGGVPHALIPWRKVEAAVARRKAISVHNKVSGAR